MQRMTRSWLAMAAAFLAFALEPARAQIDFEEVTAPAGFELSTVEVADLDGDGHLDVFGAYGSDVRVFFGFGDGTFANGSTFASVGEPYDSATSDFNRDGFLDLALVVAEAAGRDVVVLMGDSAAGFGLPQRLSTSFRERRIATGDFDGDSAIDLAANADDDILVVHWGNGDGSFGDSIVLDAPSAWTLAAGDVNGDGLGDLVSCRSIYLSDGRRGFERRPSMCLGYIASVVVDLDIDGNLDAIGSLGDVLYWYRGDGTGTFEFRDSYTYFSLYGYGLAAADFDEDGFPDVVSANWSGGGGAVSIFISDPAFGLFIGSELYGKCSLNVRTGDFDEDGHEDFVVDSWPITTWLNRMFEDDSCVAGNVNRGVGERADVLFVNGSSGVGGLRRVIVRAGEPLTISMAAPPSKPLGPARFALYPARSYLDTHSETSLPFEIGDFCFRGPFDRSALDGLPYIANNIGHNEHLGAERWPGGPTEPAPSEVLHLRKAPAFFGFFLQGLIVDRAAPNGRLAVTNRVFVVSE